MHLHLYYTKSKPLGLSKFFACNIIVNKLILTQRGAKVIKNIGMPKTKKKKYLSLTSAPLQINSHCLIGSCGKRVECADCYPTS